jgi:hypothetical protein
VLALRRHARGGRPQGPPLRHRNPFPRRVCFISPACGGDGERSDARGGQSWTLALASRPQAPSLTLPRKRGRKSNPVLAARFSRALISFPPPLMGKVGRGHARLPASHRGSCQGTYATQGATQAMLPGTWSARALPAFACPSSVSTSRTGLSAGSHDARAARGRAVSSRPRAPTSLRIPEYLRERRPSLSEILWHVTEMGTNVKRAIMQELTKNLRHGNILLRSDLKGSRHGKTS